MVGAFLRVTLWRVEAGPDRRAAHADLPQDALNGLQRPDLVLERLRKRVELLAERHRNSVLQLRPPHLEDVRELLALRTERVDQVREGSDDLGVAECHADV